MIEYAIGAASGFVAGFVTGLFYMVYSVQKKLKRMGQDTIENFFRDAAMKENDLQLGFNPELGSKEYQEALKDRKEVND